MPGPARVDSIHALREFRAALIRFADEARSALDSAQGELHRVSHRLASELPAHWRGEQRRWEEEVVRAKIALEHALSQAQMGKSSVDERKALARAKENVSIARTKLEHTKRWSRELDREHTLYRGQVESLARIIEGDIPRGLARLDRMAEELDRYTTVRPPEDQHSGAHTERAMASAVGGEARAGDDTYQRWRSLRPHPDTTRDAERRDRFESAQSWTLSLDDRRALALASGGSPPADLRLDVSVAAPLSDDVLVLQRDDPVDASDSGWRIHSDHPERWVRVPCVRLLGALPDLPSVARCPSGTLLLIEGGRVVALFDTIGSDTWAALRHHDEDPGNGPTKEDGA
jgi:hypothetical protein